MFRCTSTLNETLNEVSPQDSLTSRFRSILLGYWAFMLLFSSVWIPPIFAYRGQADWKFTLIGVNCSVVCWYAGHLAVTKTETGIGTVARLFFYNDEKNYFYYTNTFYCQYCFCRITFTRISKWRIWKNDGTSKDGWFCKKPSPD